MFKQLLLSAAAAAMAFSVSAETKVLWTADDPAGKLVAWGDPALTLTAEQMADINIGDTFVMTISGVDPEDEWPQAAIFEGNVDWPPSANEGVGGKEYPYAAKFPMTNNILKGFKENGIVFKGSGAYVSQISVESAPFEVDPYAVWFGPKQCNWGNPVSINSATFANVGPYDKIEVAYDKTAPEHTLQFLFGGWAESGCNVPTYEAWKTDFLTNDEEAGVYTIELTPELDNFIWGDDQKEYDLYALLKKDGLLMHGPCTVNQVLYIPLADTNQKAYETVLAEIEAAEVDYKAALQAVATDYPSYDLSEWEEIIGGAIEEAKTGAKQALAAANEDRALFFYPFDRETIDGQIEAMKLYAANDALYQAVLAQIEAAEADYKAALEQIETDYPTYDLTEWEEIIGGTIKEAKTGAKQALDSANEDGETFFYSFDRETIDGQIGAMKLYAANDAAYNAVLAQIEAAEADYKDALEAIETDYPTYDLTEWKEIIGGAIEEAKTGAKQALAAANEDRALFFYPFDRETIDGQIEAMKLYAANDAAYKAVLAEIDAVEAEYNTAVQAISDFVPDFDPAEWEIADRIKEAKEGAEQALAAANEDFEPYNFKFGAEDILASIAEMKKAGFADYNKAAYDKVIAAITAVETEYNDAVEAIKEVNPEFDFSEWAEIATQINDAKTNADQALAAANDFGEKFNFQFTGEDIENFITEMKKAGFADYNKAEYASVITAIEALEAEYTAAIAEIEKENPDFDLTEWKQIIGVKLQEEKTGADQALAAANENGEIFFFPFDADYYKGMIEEMKAAAKSSGIANIEAEVAAGNAKIFTLDGKSHNAPVKGQVNVIVRGNSTMKVMIDK